MISYIEFKSDGHIILLELMNELSRIAEQKVHIEPHKQMLHSL